MSKFLNDVQFNGFQALQFRLENLASAPGSTDKGHVYFDTVTNAQYVYDGTSWVPTDARKATNIPNTALATNPLARANHTGTQAASTISDLATVVKAYRLDEFAAPTASVSFNSQKITNLADGTVSGDAVNYGQLVAGIQDAAAGIDSKPSVRVLYTTNQVALLGFIAVDGVTPVDGDRLLLVGQTTASENGPWIAHVGAWTRPTASVDTVTPGSFWFVEEGTTYGGTQWRTATTGAIVLDTTDLTILQFGAATSYTFGDGLNLTGSNVTVVADDGISVSSSGVAVVADTGITVSGSGVGVDFSVVPKKFSASVGDGSTTSFTITHNLGTRDVAVSFYEAATPWQSVTPDWFATTTNTITATFGAAPTTNQYRVSVIG